MKELTLKVQDADDTFEIEALDRSVNDFEESEKLTGISDTKKELKTNEDD